MKYSLIDSGNQKKFELFGTKRIIRPCPQAIWKAKLSEWEDVDAEFFRIDDKGWTGNLPMHWIVEHDNLKFQLSPTDFGHLGIFPEHKFLWSWGAARVQKDSSILNLFAYSGGATLAFARAGAKVCHVDASSKMVKRARENAALNGLEQKPIRWIVDDVMKFLERELRREKTYDGILLDPPSFGRGPNKEVFIIEKDLPKLLLLCKKLLGNNPLFLICSNHSNELTPFVMKHLFEEIVSGSIETGELILEASEGRDLPTGTFARWHSC